MLDNEHGGVDGLREVVDDVARHEAVLLVDEEAAGTHVEEEGENAGLGVEGVLLALAAVADEVGEVGGAEGGGELSVGGDDACAHTARQLAELQLPEVDPVRERGPPPSRKRCHGLILQRVLYQLHPVLRDPALLRPRQVLLEGPVLDVGLHVVADDDEDAGGVGKACEGVDFLVVLAHERQANVVAHLQDPADERPDARLVRVLVDGDRVLRPDARCQNHSLLQEGHVLLRHVGRPLVPLHLLLAHCASNVGLVHFLLRLVVERHAPQGQRLPTKRASGHLCVGTSQQREHAILAEVVVAEVMVDWEAGEVQAHRAAGDISFTLVFKPQLHRMTKERNSFSAGTTAKDFSLNEFQLSIYSLFR
jgi:hypothetical protein